MISYVTSIFKIILGSLIAHYFHRSFIGGWWAGVVVLTTSILGLCSISGFMLALNIALNFLSLLLTIYAVIVDSMLADYFSFKIQKCHFSTNSIHCYCDETYAEYQALIYYLEDADCNNPFARNPQLLIINAALSAMCFLVSLIIFALLVTAYSYIFFSGAVFGPSVHDYLVIY
jgi:hypothetical protein